MNPQDPNVASQETPQTNASATRKAEVREAKKVKEAKEAKELSELSEDDAELAFFSNQTASHSNLVEAEFTDGNTSEHEG